MPGNFQFLGLIHAALPDARFIHMQRSPLDTCLSIYFQNFSVVHPYANDLGDLAHFYAEYQRVLQHWRESLPAGVLRVATGAMFFVELILPFLIFCPRRLRFAAAFGILMLQICILLTGNYNWFNLQTMLLCLPLFECFGQCRGDRIGEPGEITRVIQAKFEDALHGRAEEYLEWLDPVEVGAGAPRTGPSKVSS